MPMRTTTITTAINNAVFYRNRMKKLLALVLACTIATQLPAMEPNQPDEKPSWWQNYSGLGSGIFQFGGV